LFSTISQSTTTYFQTFSSFLDIEEVPSLVKYLEFVKLKLTVPEKDVEYWYNSKDLAITVFYQDASGRKAEKWNYAVKVDRYYPSSTFYFNAPELFLDFANLIKDDFEKRKE
jgi:hypothetical protein